MNTFSYIKTKLDSFIEWRLKAYENADFGTKQKAKLFYPIAVFGIITLIILMFSSIYVQLNTMDGIIDPSILILELLLLIIFLMCMYLLVKGYYQFSSQLFLLSATLCAWIVIFIGESDFFTRVDTVVLLFAVLNTVPLFLSKKKATIFVYVTFNILMVILFAVKLQNEYDINKAQFIDFIMDTSLAFLFSGIAGYHILKLNQKILNKVESDYNERLKAEKELAESEYRYRNLFENAQIGIYRTTPEGEILQLNPAMQELQGLTSIQEVVNKNFNDADVFVNTNRHLFIEQIEKDGFVKDLESVWTRKDGESVIVRENARAVRDEKGKTMYYEGFVINITEQKKAEEAIRESELKYTALFENAQMGIFQTNPDGQIIKANPALVNILGFDSVDELVGRNLITDNFFVKTDRSAFESLMVKQGYVSNFESEWRKKNGEIITIKENSRTVKDEKGNRVYLEGFIEDITERRKIEMALKENEEKYRSLMDNMNDLVMFVDNDDKILYVNKRFKEKIGYSDSELIGKIGYKLLLSPDDQEIILKANKERIQNISSQYEATFIAKDGTKFDFLVSGAPVRDADDNIIGSIGNMIDITERKIAEEKLRKSQQLFHTLAHTSPVGIFRTRPDGYTTYVNPKWMEISGLTFEEALGNGWLNAVYPEDKKVLAENWQLYSKEGKESIAEYRFLKPDGSVVWVLGNAVPEVLDGKIQGFIGTVTDITERKIAEKKIKESEEKYRTIIEVFPDIIMISDLERNILYANDALENYTGITPKDYRNKNRKAKIHPDDTKLMQDAIKELLDGDQTHKSLIGDCLKSNKSVILNLFQDLSDQL